MISVLPTPVLSVTPEGVRELDGREALSNLWTLFTKCKESIENGRRLENISWRLWYREMLISAPRERFPAFDEGLLDEKAYRPPTPIDTLLPSDQVDPSSTPQSGLLSSYPPHPALASPRKNQSQADVFRKPLRPLPFGQIICEMLPDAAHAAHSPATSLHFGPRSMSSSYGGHSGITRNPRSEPLIAPSAILGRSELGYPNLDPPFRSFLPLLPLPESTSGPESHFATSSQLPTPGTERDESAPFVNASQSQQQPLPLPSPSLHTTPHPISLEHIPHTLSSIPSHPPGNTPKPTATGAQDPQLTTVTIAGPPSPSLSDSYSRAHPNEVTDVDHRQALGLPEIHSRTRPPVVHQTPAESTGITPPPLSDPLAYPSVTPMINENLPALPVVSTPPRLVVVNPTPGPTPQPTPPATPSTFLPSGDGGKHRSHGQFLAPPGRRISSNSLAPIPAPVFNVVTNTAAHPHVSSRGNTQHLNVRVDEDQRLGNLPPLGRRSSSQDSSPEASTLRDTTSPSLQYQITSSDAVASTSRKPSTPPTQVLAPVAQQPQDKARSPGGAITPASQNPHRLSSSSTISTVSTAVTNTSDTSSSSHMSAGATSVHTDGSFKDGGRGESNIQTLRSTTTETHGSSSVDNATETAIATAPSSPIDDAASPVSPPAHIVASGAPSTSITSITSVKSTKSAKSAASAKGRSTTAQSGRPGAPGLKRRASSGGTSTGGGRSRVAAARNGRAANSSDASRSRSRDEGRVGVDVAAAAVAAGVLAAAMGMTTTSGATAAAGRKRLGGGTGRGKSRPPLGRTSSRGAGLGGNIALTRTLSHEDVQEVDDEDEDEEESVLAVVSEVRVKVAERSQDVRVGPSRPKFGFGSHSDDGSGVAKSFGTEVSSRAPGSLVVPSGLSQAALRAAEVVADTNSKGKGREIDPQREDRTVQDHVSQQRELAQAATAAELQRVKEAKKEQRRKMAEAVALVRAQESLADPLLPQAKRTILLTSESEYTDTDEDSWTSEEVEEGAGSSRPQPEPRQASQPEIRQQIQPPVQAVQQQQLQQQLPQKPTPPPLQRTQSNASGHNRTSRREWQHIQQRREAQLRVQKAAAQLQREEEEKARTREMFAKRPTASFQNLTEINRTESFGLLTQLMNPDPAIFPPNHPYRRGHSSGEIPRMNMSAMAMTAAQPMVSKVPEKQVERQQVVEPERKAVQPVQQQRPQQQSRQQILNGRPLEQQQQPRPHAPLERPHRRSSLQEGAQKVPPPPPPVAAPAAPPALPPLARVSTDPPPKAPTAPPSPVKSERRKSSATNIAVAFALRGMRGLGLQLNKSTALNPLPSQVQVGSVKPKGIVAPPSIAPDLRSAGTSSGQRPKGPLPDQEMEETDSEDEPENSVQLSQSVAQHRLKQFAARKGIVSSGNHLPTQQETDEIPAWAREAPAPKQAVAGARAPAVPPSQPSGPIPVMHPYNLPFNAAPSTPRTTRRQMLRSEMSESLRRQLLWERQQAGIRRTSSTTTAGAGPSRYSALNPLRPFTTTPSMVQLHAKGTVKQEELQRQKQHREHPEGGARGSGDRERRASGSRPAGEEEMEERRRRAMARNRSWADNYHTSGW